MAESEKITVDGKSLKEFVDEQLGVEARSTFFETIRRTDGMKKYLPCRAKLRYDTKKDRSGRVRQLSEQEVFEMNQKELAKTFNPSFEGLFRKEHTEKRREALLEFIKSRVEQHGNFSIGRDILPDPSQLYSYIRDHLTEAQKKKDGTLLAYHHSGVREDVTSLCRVGLLHRRGHHKKVVYQLGPEKNPEEAIKNMPVKKAPVVKSQPKFVEKATEEHGQIIRGDKLPIKLVVETGAQTITITIG